MSDSEPYIVFVTYPAGDEAEEDAFSRRLVEEGGAACVNILDEVDSYFYWEGQLEEAEEVLLVVKTNRATYPHLESLVIDHHPYDEPEVIAFSLEDGAQSYLDWIDQTLTGNDPEREEN